MLIFLSIMGGENANNGITGCLTDPLCSPGRPRAALLGRTRGDAGLSTHCGDLARGSGLGVPDSEAHSFLIRSLLRGQYGAFGFFPDLLPLKAKTKAP